LKISELIKKLKQLPLDGTVLVAEWDEMIEGWQHEEVSEINETEPGQFLIQ
jgi:hypothetical protein